MGWISGRPLAFCAMVVVSTSAGMPAAQAQDFFSALFGGMASRPGPAISLPLSTDGDFGERRELRPRVASGGRQAFCVRTCDGRYFPISATDSASRAASCNNFCPASETKIVYGSSIDQAATDTGKPYSELPNAFKYRTELVPGCTCNGKDQVGLAPVKVEDDPTLRKGDIVAGADGLMITGRPDRRGASLNMSPAPDAVRAKFERPVVQE
ncbi:MAG: hypothetical protein JWQ94_4488 [Tardiphaga sp.]|nr:hypothetical protein [Tardiphaga sp.]